MMSYDLNICKNRNSSDLFEIDCLSYGFRKPGYGSGELKEYIELFSRLVSENQKKLKYIVSDTLTRIEGRTYFFDKLSKYVQLVELIEAEQRNIRIKNLDRILFKALAKYLKQRKIDFEGVGPGIFAEAKRVLRFPARVALMFVIDALIAFMCKRALPKDKRREYDHLVLSFYDYRCSRSGAYCDSYFQPLIEHLVKEGKDIMVLSTPIITDNPRHFMSYMANLKEMIRCFKNLRKECEIKFYYCFLTMGDLFKSYIMGVGSFVRVRQAIRYHGIDIRYLLNLSLADDYVACYWGYAWKQYFMFKRLFRDFNISGSIIYPYENHPWEKLLVAARNESGAGTKLTAFQHTSFSLKLLQYFPGSYESGLPFYPDKILTVGDILRDVMNEVGSYRDGLVESGCALRHGYLFPDRDGDRKKDFCGKIAYAFSFDTKVYEGVIRSLVEVFEGTGYTVYLKIHPIVPEEAVIKTKLPENIVPAKHMKWDDLFKEIDILIYDDNSLGIEALMYGVDVAYFSLADRIYDCDRLFKYEKDKKIINSIEELRAYIKGYYEGAQRKGRDDFDTEYIYRYFLPVTRERLEKFI